MSSYLWDRSGEPDPEIEQLEQLLAQLRFQSKGPVLRRRRRTLWVGLAAASLMIGLLGFQTFSSLQSKPTDWVIAGVGRQVLKGERVRAGGRQPIALESSEFGRIELQPDSEVQVVESSPGHQLMQLQRGSLHALIWAPPGQFMVDTPSARAIDLGCQYELSVDKEGDGFVRVQTGWVAFQNREHESFIPAGAACRTTRKNGLGIPYFENAAEEFRTALAQFERKGDQKMLAIVLAKARPDDGVSLWHLLGRVPAAQRADVFDRFAQLVGLPEGTDREKALAGDTATLDVCWNALELSDAGWWRQWKRTWR